MLLDAKVQYHPSCNERLQASLTGIGR